MRKRFQTKFAPAAFVFGLDELLEKSGTDLWLDTLACLPVVKHTTVTGVEVENKSGRITLQGTCIIDATGDADIAAGAQAPCVERGSLPGTLYYSTGLKKAQAAVQKGSAGDMITWEGVGANEMGRGYKGTSAKYSGVIGQDISRYLMECRKLAREQMSARQQELGPDGRENLYPIAIPAMHQIRMTRRIDGEDIVKDGMMNRNHPDSIGMIADCRKTNAVWEVPYGSILPRKVDNLLVVGRCSAAEEYVWQVTRLIQSAALTGQVAGIAAELAIRRKTTPRALEVKLVQQHAVKQGIALHI